MDIIKEILKKLAPKPRSALRRNPRISDGSYPVGMYDRDREQYRRHDEGYGRSRSRRTNEEEKEKETNQADDKAEGDKPEKPDWKIRDEQYREDYERERRHEEGYWQKQEESKSSSSDSSQSESSSTADESRDK